MPRHAWAPADAERPGAGVELFALCQTAAADGHLPAQQVQALRAWRDSDRALALPAQRYTLGLVDHFIAAGRIFGAELLALQRVLEPALPLGLRCPRPAALRLVGQCSAASSVYGGYAGYGASAPPRADALDPSARGARTRNELLASAHFIVAECWHGSRRAPGRVRPGEPVLLVRVADSPHGPDTIEVRRACGKPIGFVPAQHALRLAPLLDAGARYRAHLTALYSGELAPVLIAQAHLYAAGAMLGTQSAVVRKVGRRSSLVPLWLVRTAVALLITTMVALALHA